MFDDSTAFPRIALGADGGRGRRTASEEGIDGERFWILTETAFAIYPCQNMMPSNSFDDNFIE